jgi:hypothetical protein
VAQVNNHWPWSSWLAAGREPGSSFEGGSRHVLRFPPEHCEINLIELIWAQTVVI